MGTRFEAGRPCQMILFPLVDRVGRIREVAEKMMDKPTERAAAHYRKVVDEAFVANFERIGLSKDEQDAQLARFWMAVAAEINRMAWSGQNSGGAA